MNAHTIRVVVFEDGDHFIAQALEVDVAAQGRTADEASRRLEAALAAENRDAQSVGRTIFDIGPAPDAIRVLYEDKVVSREEKLVA